MRKFQQLILLLLFLVPLPMQANMGDPERPGDPLGEPSPSLDSIRVLYEHLVIDMRSCDSNQPVRIIATYRLYNSGIKRDLDLVFMAGRLHEIEGGFSIRIDDSLVSGRRTDTLTLPVSWGLPRFTPGFDGEPIPYTIVNNVPPGRVEGYYQYRVSDSTSPHFGFNAAIEFRLLLDSGEHSVTVEYLADPSSLVDKNGKIYNWQIGYALAPARDWQGFDSLDVDILLPDGWEARSNPQMEVVEGGLHGSWSELPADGIGITARLHLSWFEEWFVGMEDIIEIGGVLFVLLAPIIIGIRKGRKAIHRKEPGNKGVGALLLQNLVVALLPYVVIILYWSVKDSMIRDQSLPSYAFLYLFLLIPLIIGGIILGLSAFFISKDVAARSLRKRNAEEEKDFH